MSWCIRLLLASQLLYVLSSAQDVHPDRVFNLPGAPAEPSFPLYSGYLDAYIAPDNHMKRNVAYVPGTGYSHQRIFYVLCEAIRVNPLEAPLVVWLNGGPGSSSLLGLLIEHGPYLLEAGKLRYNDLSWNQYANVLYIESPTGVGFSHTNASVHYNDDLTATLNVKVLQDFMTRKHPRYATRDFYITGQSYAGFYIPYFARAILRGLRDGDFFNGNFKGIAIGNALMDNHSARVAAAKQMFAMGMIPEKHGADLFDIWQNDLYDSQKDLPHWETLNALEAEIYNIRLICEQEGWSEEEWHISRPIQESECNSHYAMQRYLNRADVQKSLNVIRGNETAREWFKSSEEVHEKYNDWHGWSHHFGPTGIVPMFRQIDRMAKGDFRILYFTGDFDLMCPTIHVARGAAIIADENEMEGSWILKLMIKCHEIADAPKLWTYLGDFGGVQTSYKSKMNNITMDVITVRGAGHLVPTDQPSRAFQVFNNFLSTESPIDYSKKIRRRN